MVDSKVNWFARAVPLAKLSAVRVNVVVILVLMSIVGVYYVVFFKSTIPMQLTYGKIWVDSPEIYTRERLVNDRFVQDAWLRRFLNVNDAQAALRVRTQDFSSDIGVSDDNPVEPPLGSNITNSERMNQVRVSTRDKFIDQVDFRDSVRNLMIENQLDDRHDLHGNSLYRLKFDATIAPGQNTQATAQITIKLTGPTFSKTGDLSAHSESQLPPADTLDMTNSIVAWRVVYLSWLESLQARLNQTHQELKQGFLHNEFSHDDYVLFHRFLQPNFDQQESCMTDIVDFSTQSDGPLDSQQHLEHKRCIGAVIRSSLPTAANESTMEENQQPQTDGSERPETDGRKQSTYLELRTPRDATSPTVFPRGPASNVAKASNLAGFGVVAKQLDYKLNSYFGSKTVQLVLGLVVPERAFVGLNKYNVPALKPLIDLTFFTTYADRADGEVFRVQEKTFYGTGIDESVTEERFNELKNIRGLFPYSEFAHFDLELPSGMKVSSAQFSVVREEGYTLSDNDFRPTETKGVYDVVAEVGVSQFARKAGLHSESHSYAVTPKENAEYNLSTLSMNSRIDASVTNVAGTGRNIGLEIQRQDVARALNRKGSVVGFGAPGDDDISTEFGWVIGPRQVVQDGTDIKLIHSAVQHSLTALVSIPSWWNILTLDVHTSWIDFDGVTEISAKSRKYVVDIPIDFEPLEATLLGVQQLGPELMESRLDPVRLTACRPGAIVIPGRRLWRSTVVTLGYQTADEITVLPNMKGIIAKFDKVENQASIREEQQREKGESGLLEIERVVRIWTSQGTIALPIPAHIGIPEDCSTNE